MRPKSLSQGKSAELHDSVNCLAHTKQHGQSGRVVTRPVEQSAAVTFFSHSTPLSQLQLESPEITFVQNNKEIKKNANILLGANFDPMVSLTLAINIVIILTE